MEKSARKRRSKTEAQEPVAAAPEEQVQPEVNTRMEKASRRKPVKGGPRTIDLKKALAERPEDAVKAEPAKKPELPEAKPAPAPVDTEESQLERYKARIRSLEQFLAAKEDVLKEEAQRVEERTAELRKASEANQDALKAMTAELEATLKKNLELDPASVERQVELEAVKKRNESLVLQLAERGAEAARAIGATRRSLEEQIEALKQQHEAERKDPDLRVRLMQEELDRLAAEIARLSTALEEAERKQKPKPMLGGDDVTPAEGMLMSSPVPAPRISTDDSNKNFAGRIGAWFNSRMRSRQRPSA